MNDALRDGVVYSGAPACDGFWLERLLEASTEEMEFRIEHFDALFLKLDTNHIAARSQLARFSVARRQHRAQQMGKFLIELYRLLRAQS